MQELFLFKIEPIGIFDLIELVVYIGIFYKTNINQNITSFI